MRGVWQVGLSRLIFNQEMREFKSRTPYRFKRANAEGDYIFEVCEVTCVFLSLFHGDYSLDG